MFFNNEILEVQIFKILRNSSICSCLILINNKKKTKLFQLFFKILLAKLKQLDGWLTYGGDHSEGEEEGVVEVPLDAAVQVVCVVP